MPSSTSTLADALEMGLVGVTAGVLRATPRERSRTATSVLAQLRDAGPLRVTTLAQRETVAQPTMTGLVNRLAREGLCERREDPDDGRAVLVAVTQDGLDALERQRDERVAVLGRALERLDDAERDLLLAALPALARLTQLTTT